MASMTKVEKENNALRSRASRAREWAKDKELTLIRKAAVGVGGAVLGAAEKGGQLASMPTIPGMPRIVTIGVVANVVALMAPAGRLGAAVDGVADSTIGIAGYKLGKGEDIAGHAEVDVGGPRRARRRIRAEQGRQRQQMQDLERRLTAQARSELGPDGGAFVDDEWADFDSAPATATF